MKNLLIYTLVAIGLSIASCSSNASEKSNDVTDQLATGAGIATAVPGVAGKAVAVASLSSLQKDSITMYHKLLQGTWISEDDKRSVIIFDGDKQIMVYDGKKGDARPFIIDYKSCDGNDADEMILKTGDDMCYAFNGLDDKTLSMMYLGNGNILIYKKKK